MGARIISDEVKTDGCPNIPDFPAAIGQEDANQWANLDIQAIHDR
jgi:hypothetical protein